MKKYEPEKMAASSRYRKYFPTLSDDIQRDFFGRIGELLTEEREYCDKSIYSHMCQILTSIWHISTGEVHPGRKIMVIREFGT